MAVDYWNGDGDTAWNTNGNWESDTAPVANDKIVLPAINVTNAPTTGLSSLNTISLSGFTVEDGFTKDIGDSAIPTGGFLELELDGSNPTRFIYRGSSTIAKIKIVDADIPMEIFKTGIGNTGSPALQVITALVNGSSTNIGEFHIHNGEVSLGPEEQACQTPGIYIGTAGGNARPLVWLGPNVTGENAAVLPLVEQHNGICYSEAVMVTLNLHRGEFHWMGGTITTLNMYGGTFVPLSASASTLTTVNMYGGTFDHTREVSTQNVGTVNMFGGTLKDPAQLLGNPGIVLKTPYTNWTLDMGLATLALS